MWGHRLSTAYIRPSRLNNATVCPLTCTARQPFAWTSDARAARTNLSPGSVIPLALRRDVKENEAAPDSVSLLEYPSRAPAYLEYYCAGPDGRYQPGSSLRPGPSYRPSLDVPFTRSQFSFFERRRARLPLPRRARTSWSPGSPDEAPRGRLHGTDRTRS